MEKFEKYSNKITAYVLSGAILANTFAPTAVFANGHMLVFRVQEGTNHTVEAANGNELNIDGSYVSFEPGDNTATVTTGCASDYCWVDVDKGGLTINFGGDTNFDLFANGHAIGSNAVFGEATDILIQDKSQQNNNDAYNIQFDGVASYEGNNVVKFNYQESDNTNTVVTMTITGATLNDNHELVIASNNISNVRFTFSTNFRSQDMEPALVGGNNYSQALAVSGDNQVSFNGLDIPNSVRFGLRPRMNGQEEHHDGEDERFDGNAYYVWKCGNNACYHKFTNMLGGYEENGVRNYYVNYIREADVTDESGNGVNYSFATYKNTNDLPNNWVLAASVEKEDGTVDPEKMTLDYVFGNGTTDMGIQLDPTGAFSGDNSEATNGDRNFRAVIYSDNYQAVEFDNNYNNYTYFPANWDPVFHSNIFDVTETNPNGGVFYETYLLEPNLTLRTAPHSKSKFVSVIPLNVNKNAVTVTKNGEDFKITFNSNYYEQVVFELTDEAGAKYYIEIHRIVANAHDNAAPGQTESLSLFYELMYPSTDNYTDYEVMATIEYGNGTSTTKKVDPVLNSIDDATSKAREAKYSYGKNLSATTYKLTGDVENIKKVYFNVVKKGALDSDKFGGAFSGSGRGYEYNNRMFRGEE